MTPIFPPEAKHQAGQVDPMWPSEKRDWFLRNFVEMADRTGVAYIYLDETHVKLPRKPKNGRTEHVRGLGHDIWASSHPRIPGAMAR